jgi:hypothetical protein
MVVTEFPTTLVPALAETNFTGAGIGSFVQVVLTPPPGTSAADPDVAADLTVPAQNLDKYFTAQQLDQNFSYIDNMQAALVNHFIHVGYSGGMVGFMTDNNLLVHKNFSTINNSRVGNTLPAANVFRPDQIILATITMGSGAVSFTAGTALGSGSGNQADTNYGPQQLVAVLVPAGGSLAAAWSFTVNAQDSTITMQTSAPIAFTAGSPAGTSIVITAPGSTNKFYQVVSALLVAGGSPGDQVFITQIVERQISL